MHIKQTHKSDTQPNLLKEHVSQTHGLTEIENNETPTRNIRKPGVVGNLNLCSFNENCNGLTGLCSKVPYDLIFEPLGGIQKKATARSSTFGFCQHKSQP